MISEGIQLAASTTALLTSRLSQVASAAANNTDLWSGDVMIYGGLSLQLSGTWSATVSFQTSNDGTTWASCAAFPVGGVAASAATSASSNGQWYIPILGRFFRVRTTAYTSGTVLADLIAFDQQRDTGQTTGSLAISSGSITPLPSATTGGFNTTHHLVSAASTNATSVKASAGTIGLITVSNKNAAPVYFKLYNKASAPTVGTDTPVMTVLVPTNGTVVVPHPTGLRLSTGIAYALTTGLAVADTGAVTAGDVAVHISYV